MIYARRFFLQVVVEPPATCEGILEACRLKFNSDVTDVSPGEDHFFLQNLNGPIISQTEHLRPKMFYYNSRVSPLLPLYL